MNRGPVFVFPGQGSQRVGMVDQFLDDRSDEVIQHFTRASRICGVDLFTLCQNGPEEELSLTANAQPALLTLGVLACRLFTERTGVFPSTVAGHSLGEYTALVVAGCLSFEDAVRIVRRRGELMQKAVPVGTGTMIALVGLSVEQVEKMVRHLSTRGRVEIANLNSSDQTVLSLETAMKDPVLEYAKSSGVKRSAVLKVSAPFHSSFMHEAAQELASLLRAVSFHSPQFRYLTNVDGSDVQDPDQIRELLVRQMVSPVQWKVIVDRLIREGYREFFEIGPGRILSRLIKREHPESSVYTVDSLESIDRFQQERGDQDSG